jgi:hypothetical protein
MGFGWGFASTKERRHYPPAWKLRSSELWSGFLGATAWISPPAEKPTPAIGVPERTTPRRRSAPISVAAWQSIHPILLFTAPPRDAGLDYACGMDSVVGASAFIFVSDSPSRSQKIAPRTVIGSHSAACSTTVYAEAISTPTP